MMRIALIALAAILCVQDDPRIKDLIKKLDAPELDQREKAMQELIAAGEAAVPALKAALASDSAEVKMRVEEILRGIETAKKAREVWREARHVEVKFEEAPLAEILAELSKQSGVKIDTSAVSEAARGSLVAKGPVLQAIDRLCAAQEKLTWETRDADLRMVADKHVPYPADYAGPFKIHLGMLEVSRSTNFKESNISFTFGMASIWEPDLKPLKRTKFEFAGCKDDQGRAVEVGPWGFDMPAVAGAPGMVIVKALGMGAAPMEGGERFSVKGLAADAKSVTLAGTARFHFPLDYTPVAFEDVIGGDRRQVGDFSIQVKKVDSARGYITFTVTRTSGESPDLNEEIERRLDSASVIAVDAEKGEHVADTVGPSHERGGIAFGPGGIEPQKSVTMRANFAGLAKKDIKSFKFRFIDKTLEKAVKFEIKVNVP